MNDNTKLEQKNEISDLTSKGITSLRYLLSVLIVFAHNNFTVADIVANFTDPATRPIFVQNEFGRWLQFFISLGIANCAVPLFFLFSAFLQVKKNDSYPVLLKKRSKSLLLPYVIWMVLYAVYSSFGKYLIFKLAPNLLNNPDTTFLTWTFADWFHKFIGYAPDFSYPAFAAQFWFVRDLFILVVISPVLKLIIKKIPVGYLCLLAIAYIIPVKVYFVQNNALIFYSLGLYWGMYDFDLFEKLKELKWREILPVYVLLYVLLEIYSTVMNQGYVISLLMLPFTCIVILKFSFVIMKNDKVYSAAAYLSAYSFFLYAIHGPALLDVAKKLWIRYLPMKNTFFCLLEYFGVSFLVIIIGTSVGIILRKICLPLFSLLNGGRK